MIQYLKLNNHFFYLIFAKIDYLDMIIVLMFSMHIDKYTTISDGSSVSDWPSVSDGIMGSIRAISLFGTDHEQLIAAVIEDATGADFIYMIKTSDGECVKVISSHFGNFIYAIDIEFDSIGKLYVCDYETRCIQIFDNSGDSLEILDTSTELDEPRGITFDKNDNMLIYDNGDGVIKVFDKNGNKITSFGEGIIGYQDVAAELCGIDIHRDGTIGIIDNTNGSIFLFDPNYNLTHTILNSNVMSDISFRENDEIFITDWSHDSIYIYNRDGDVLNTLAIKQPCAIVANSFLGIFVGTLHDNLIRYLIIE